MGMTHSTDKHESETSKAAAAEVITTIIACFLLIGFAVVGALILISPSIVFSIHPEDLDALMARHIRF